MSKQTTENTAFHAMDAAEALRILKSDRESGLRAADAEARLQKYGPNALKKAERKRFCSASSCSSAISWC